MSQKKSKWTSPPKAGHFIFNARPTMGWGHCNSLGHPATSRVDSVHRSSSVGPGLLPLWFGVGLVTGWKENQTIHICIHSWKSVHFRRDFQVLSAIKWAWVKTGWVSQTYYGQLCMSDPQDLRVPTSRSCGALAWTSGSNACGSWACCIT